MKTANLDRIQYEMNEILSSFINGGFSSVGYLLYPAYKGVSRDLIKRLQNLFAYLKSEANIEFDSSIRKFEILKNRLYSPKAIPILIAELYKNFDACKPDVSVKKAKPRLNLLKETEYRTGYLKPVLEFKRFAEKNLRQYLADVYLHGSLSTLDYVEGWSDFDTLAVVKKSTIMDSKRLLKLRNLMYASRRFFYKVDPLQHHGHAVISEYDYDYYCQAFFPVTVFEHSKSFFGNGIERLYVRPSVRENNIKPRWFIDYFKNINAEALKKSYNLKFFLHGVTLFPTLYLQTKNKQVYKKFSFGIVKNQFKDKFGIIDYVSSLRNNWKHPKKFYPIIPYSTINPLLTYRINSAYWDIGSRYLRLNNLAENDLKIMVDKMREVAEYVENS